MDSDHVAELVVRDEVREVGERVRLDDEVRGLAERIVEHGEGALRRGQVAGVLLRALDAGVEGRDGGGPDGVLARPADRLAGGELAGHAVEGEVGAREVGQGHLTLQEIRHAGEVGRDGGHCEGEVAEWQSGKVAEWQSGEVGSAWQASRRGATKRDRLRIRSLTLPLCHSATLPLPAFKR